MHCVLLKGELQALARVVRCFLVVGVVRGRSVEVKGRSLEHRGTALQTRWGESARATYLPFGWFCGDLSSFLSSGCMAAFRSGEGDGFWAGFWGLLGELGVCVMRDSNR